jgi:hypothetical protein
VPHERFGVTRDRRVRAGPVGPLIRPPGNEYEPMNIHIHGITPSFPHAGAHERSALLHGGVAGGAVTPLRPARRCAQCTLRPRRHPGLPLGGGRSTRRASFPMHLRARAWPGWPSYRLNAVAQACGVSFKHHRAGEGAAAAAQVGEPSAGPPDNLPSSGQLARSECPRRRVSMRKRLEAPADARARCGLSTHGPCVRPGPRADAATGLW